MTSLKHRLPAAFRTARLVLTAPAAAHVPAIAKLANNRRIYEVMSRLPFPYEEDDARYFVEQIAPSPEECCYAILDGQENFMGVVGLRLEEGEWPELGYWLGEPYWGFGYATEAALPVVAAARAAGAPGLRSRARKDNAASRKVLAKLGFEEVGDTTDTEGALAGRPLVRLLLDFGP
jgi:RimJ/RimL family protein N-acetyltransferase